MRRWRAVRLVARREIRERLRSRGFRLATALMVAGAIAAGVVPSVLEDDEDPIVVGVVGAPAPSLRPGLQLAAGGTGDGIDAVRFRTTRDADAALRRGEADVVVAGGDLRVRGDGTSERAWDLARRLAAAIPLRAGLESAGVAPERIDRLLAPSPLPVHALEPSGGGDRGSRDAAFISTFVLYLALLTYGGWVATGVLEERSSRVVEVILAAVRPSELLGGKVVGIGLVGLGQLAVVGAAGLVAAVVAGTELPPSSAFSAVGLVLAWFILGFAFYSCVFAALGAAASGPEDAQSAMSPLIGLLVGAFMLSTVVQASPDGLWAQLGSFLPPVAPVTMPARLLLGDPPAWEPVVSLVLTGAGAYALVRLGARAYGGAVLRFGPRLGIRDLWSSAVGLRPR